MIENTFRHGLQIRAIGYLSWSWDDYWGGTDVAKDYKDSRMTNKFGEWNVNYIKARPR